MLWCIFIVAILKIEFCIQNARNLPCGLAGKRLKLQFVLLVTLRLLLIAKDPLPREDMVATAIILEVVSKKNRTVSFQTFSNIHVV